MALTNELTVTHMSSHDTFAQCETLFKTEQNICGPWPWEVPCPRTRTHSRVGRIDLRNSLGPEILTCAFS